MISVEFMGGPRDGEVRGLPSPAPPRIEFTTWQSAAWTADGTVLPDVTGVYVRDPDLRFRGAMVRYNWKGWETR